MTDDGRLSPDDIAHIKDRVGLLDYIGRTVKLTHLGREHVGFCPFHKETKESFTVRPDKGFFKCFSCGEAGDVIAFVQKKEGLSFGEAARKLQNDWGLDTATPEEKRKAAERERQAERWRQAEAEKKRADGIRAAREIWHHARRDFAKSPAESYLRSRGLVPGFGWPPTLRWATAEKYIEKGDPQDGTFWPAMIAPLQLYDFIYGTSELVAVHKTYLAADGSGKAPVETAKKMRGAPSGAAIRLAKAGPVLGIAEGIETGLTVLQACAKNPPAFAPGGLPVWVAGSLGNIAGGGLGEGEPHPNPPEDNPNKRLPSTVPDMTRPGVVLPPEVRLVVLLADNDSKDPENARALLERGANRYRAENRQVSIAWPEAGKDFNDMAPK